MIKVDIWILIEKEIHINNWQTERSTKIFKRLNNCNNTYVIEGGQIDSEETLKEIEKDLINFNGNNGNELKDINFFYAIHQGQNNNLQNHISYEYSLYDNMIKIFDKFDKTDWEKKTIESEGRTFGIKDIFNTPTLYDKIPDLFQQLEVQQKTDEQVAVFTDLNLYISTLKLLLKTRQDMNSVSETLTDNLGNLVSNLNRNKFLLSYGNGNHIQELNRAINELKENSVDHQKLQNTIKNCNELAVKLQKIIQRIKKNNT